MTTLDIEGMIMSRFEDEDIIEASTGMMRDRLVEVTNVIFRDKIEFDSAKLHGSWSGERIELYADKGGKALNVYIGKNRTQICGLKTDSADVVKTFETAEEAREWIKQEDEV